MSRSVHSRDNSSNCHNSTEYMDDHCHVSDKSQRILLKFPFTRGLISLELSLISFSSWSTAPVNLHYSSMSAFECCPRAGCSSQNFIFTVCLLSIWLICDRCVSRSCFLKRHPWLEARRRRGLRILSSLSSKVLRTEPALSVSCLECPNLPSSEPHLGTRGCCICEKLIVRGCCSVFCRKQQGF